MLCVSVLVVLLRALVVAEGSLRLQRPDAREAGSCCENGRQLSRGRWPFRRSLGGCFSEACGRCICAEGAVSLEGRAFHDPGCASWCALL